jgi:hypothetical protein
MATPPVAKLTPEQWALVRKIVSYYVKHRLMISEYKNAKSRAIARYRATPFVEERKRKYEKAWEYMPANYEAKISAITDRLVNWVISYCKKMFNVDLTPEEARTIVTAITSGVTPLS